MFLSRILGVSEGAARVVQARFYNGRFMDPFAVLGTNPSATSSELRSRYYQLAKAYHPDSGGENASKERFIQLVEAFKQLQRSGHIVRPEEEYELSDSAKRLFLSRRPGRFGSIIQGLFDFVASWENRSYDVLIHESLKHKDLAEALLLYDEMLDKIRNGDTRLRPTVRTYAYLIRGIGLQMTQEYVDDNADDMQSIRAHNDVLFRRAMELDRHRAEWFELPRDNWTTVSILDVCRKVLNVEVGWRVFCDATVRATDHRQLPNRVGFEIMLDLCNRAGDYKKGFLVFEEYQEIVKASSLFYKFQIQPTPVMCSLMIEASAEGGRLGAESTPKVVEWVANRRFLIDETAADRLLANCLSHDCIHEGEETLNILTRLGYHPPSGLRDKFSNGARESLPSNISPTHRDEFVTSLLQNEATSTGRKRRKG
eukprot:Rmarinus@m.27716